MTTLNTILREKLSRHSARCLTICVKASILSFSSSYNTPARIRKQAIIYYFDPGREMKVDARSVPYVLSLPLFLGNNTPMTSKNLPT